MLKVGLIGFGLAGQAFHAPIIRGTSGLELSCILARSETLAHEKYPDVRIVKTLDELLADESIQLCVVATPNSTHVELSGKCLLAGRHVVVDKPFAPTLREAEELVELAAQQRRLLSVYQSRRFDGDFQTVKGIIESGILGEITDYEARYDRYRPVIKANAWQERKGPSTGRLLDLGPHLMDQALLLFGAPQAITARLFHHREGEVNDGFDAALEYPNFRAMLRVRILAYAPSPHFVIHGKKGSFLKYGMDPQEEFLRKGSIPSGTDWGSTWGEDPEELWGTVSLADGTAPRKIKTAVGDYRRYYANVRDAILGKGELAVTPQQALRVMYALELAARSHQEQRTVRWEKN